MIKMAILLYQSKEERCVYLITIFSMVSCIHVHCIYCITCMISCVWYHVYLLYHMYGIMCIYCSVCMVSCVTKDGIRELQERIHMAAINAKDPDTHEYVIGMQVWLLCS